MARDISLEITLDETFSNCTIRQILQRALQLNIRLCAYTYQDLFNTAPLSIEDALHRIEGKEEEAPVRCQLEGTGFFLYFIKLNNEKLEVTLGTTNFPWKREFYRGKETVEFDLSRYLHLLLTLVEGLKINKIEAYIYWD